MEGFGSTREDSTSSSKSADPADAEARKAIEVSKKLGISFEPLLRSLFFFFFTKLDN